MTSVIHPEVVQPLVDKFGAEAVHMAWLAIHDWPATWLPSTRNAMDVLEFLEAKEKGQ